MIDLKEALYSSKIFLGNILFGLLLSGFLLIFIHLDTLGYLIVLLYVILNTVITIRWLMKINSYDFVRNQKSQEEALRQAMAVSMNTMRP